MKYLTKPQVQLCHHNTREEQTDMTSTEDKNWGVEEHDVRDIYWIMLCIVCEGPMVGVSVTMIEWLGF